MGEPCYRSDQFLVGCFTHFRLDKEYIALHKSLQAEIALSLLCDTIVYYITL